MNAFDIGGWDGGGGRREKPTHGARGVSRAEAKNDRVSKRQPPQKLPPPNINPAASPNVVVFLYLSVFSSNRGNPKVGGGDIFLGSYPIPVMLTYCASYESSLVALPNSTPSVFFTLAYFLDYSSLSLRLAYSPTLACCSFF